MRLKPVPARRLYLNAPSTWTWSLGHIGKFVCEFLMPISALATELIHPAMCP